jgi:phospholipase D1/2
VRTLQPGRNCWRTATADRAAFLVDAEAYFCAIRRAFVGARHSIFVVGWDVDSRVPVCRGDDSLPPRLGAFLTKLVEEHSELDVYVLGWAYAPFYVFEREAFPRIKFGAMTPDRVHFALDDSHPPGGSHHQKIVVVDDRIAFAGGLDLCDVRWDTPEHRVDDPRRVDLSGKIYRPHHDVQMAVGGPAAAVLGEVARERWRVATGEDAKPIRAMECDEPWPLPTDVENVEVAVVRTNPCWGTRTEEVRECERLWIDSIEAARRTIFVENPYFTSCSAAQALARRLREPDGPEIVIVMPQESCGWMEDFTMGVLRDRVLCTIFEADEHDRLCIVSPYVPGAGDADPPVSLNLHSKVCIVDDDFLRIGSSNLTNRSMSLDTECDLAFEANGSAEATAAIVGFRNRLLAEHLAVQPQTVEAAVEATGSISAAIERLRGGDRTLVPYSPCTSELADSILPDGTIVDPGQPLTMERIANWLFRREEFVPANRDDHGSVDPEDPRNPRRTA